MLKIKVHFIKKIAVIRSKICIGLLPKLIILITMLIVTISSISNLIIYDLSFKALKQEIRNNLVLLASNSAASINVEQLSKVTKLEDEGSETYLMLQQQLQNIKNSSRGKLRYVYTIAKTNDKYIYIIDASPIEDKDNHSSVGDDFDVTAYPVAIEGFKEATAENEPIADKEFGGLTQTGYAPIVDKNGKTIGVLAVDMDVTVLLEKEKSLKEARIFAIVLAIILAVISGFLFSKYLIKPIIELTKGTKKVAEGHLDVVVELNRTDELGQLADSFNNMTKDLKLSHEELKKYSNELEDKVAQRTTELSNVNKEIRDILDNMSQAIFTIDKDLRFNKQHSRFAVNIFGNIRFSDKSILDVFFPIKELKEERELMKLWFEKAFNEETNCWDNIKALQPVKETKVCIMTENNNKQCKYISLDFQPVYHDIKTKCQNKVAKIMVIVQDITEKKTLEQQAIQKEKEYKDNINQIVEIIKADKELFEEYLNEAKRFLDDFSPQLIVLKDEPYNVEILDELYRIMHTIKGISKVFSLERIAGHAHDIEYIFASIKEGKRTISDELLTEVFDKLDKLTTIFNETQDIYNRIVHGITMDTGKARGIKRLQKDSEFLRVRVQEFDKLSSLIDTVENILERHEIIEVNSVLNETREQLLTMRKVEMSRLFARFPRMTRDISLELGKKVKLTITGDDILVDKNIYDRICDPLIHIIRNSLDHGIEKPEERIRAGKQEEGIIELCVKQDKNTLFVEVKDDGKGLDLDKIKASAVSKGLISADYALQMKDADAIKLIFAPGFSTNDEVTAISGRGVGMDVVKTYIEEDLNGNLAIETTTGRGLRIIMEIPVNMYMGFNKVINNEDPILENIY